MRKMFYTLLMAVVVPMTAMAGDYSTYYENLPVPMTKLAKPVIPAAQVQLTDFGAKGDGVTMCTVAFQKAISALSKQGGGHLVVPAGVWLTGPISLKDNIDLHVERNAIIVFSPDKRDALKTDDNGKTADRATSGITASKRKNISITGEGTIDGNGEWWRPVKRSKVSDSEWSQFKSMGGTVSSDGQLWYPFGLKNMPDVASNAEAQERMRAHLIRLTDCENVLIEGVTVQNSPRFHIVPQRCKNVIIDGVTVRCPWNAQNGDAIDIGNSQNVLIVNNVIDCGDDGICMKGGVGDEGVKNGPCENILIMHNTVYHAHGGFVIGSEFCGGMKNIVVRHNTFSGTDTGLRFKSAIGRGGKTENIFIDHIYMTDIKDEAIVFETTYWDNHVGAKKEEAKKERAFVPDFTDIHISDVVCRGAKTGISAHGDKGMIHGIDIRNSTIFYTKTATDISAECEILMENVNLSTYQPR